MGFNSAFKGLKDTGALTLKRLELKDNIAPLRVAEIKNA
jgi:hypothetical protein